VPIRIAAEGNNAPASKYVVVNVGKS